MDEHKLFNHKHQRYIDLFYRKDLYETFDIARKNSTNHFFTI